MPSMSVAGSGPVVPDPTAVKTEDLADFIHWQQQQHKRLAAEFYEERRLRARLSHQSPPTTATPASPLQEPEPQVHPTSTGVPKAPTPHDVAQGPPERLQRKQAAWRRSVGIFGQKHKEQMAEEAAAVAQPDDAEGYMSSEFGGSSAPDTASSCAAHEAVVADLPDSTQRVKHLQESRQRAAVGRVYRGLCASTDPPSGRTVVPPGQVPAPTLVQKPQALPTPKPVARAVTSVATLLRASVDGAPRSVTPALRTFAPSVCLLCRNSFLPDRGCLTRKQTCGKCAATVAPRLVAPRGDDSLRRCPHPYRVLVVPPTAGEPLERHSRGEPWEENLPEPPEY